MMVWHFSPACLIILTGNLSIYLDSTAHYLCAHSALIKLTMSIQLAWSTKEYGNGTYKLGPKPIAPN